jgi:hypothetical protein
MWHVSETWKAHRDTLEHLQMQSASSQLGRTATPPKIEDGKTSVNFSAGCQKMPRCKGGAPQTAFRPGWHPSRPAHPFWSRTRRIETNYCAAPHTQTPPAWDTDFGTALFAITDQRVHDPTTMSGLYAMSPLNQWTSLPASRPFLLRQLPSTPLTPPSTKNERLDDRDHCLSVPSPREYVVSLGPSSPRPHQR